AIRAGHVFVDLAGSRDRLLEFSASLSGKSASAGDALSAPSGANVQVTTRVVGCSGSSAIFVLDGRTDLALPPLSISQTDAILKRSWTSDGKKHWLRAEVRSADGKLELLGNPIYINYPVLPSESDHASSILYPGKNACDQLLCSVTF